MTPDQTLTKQRRSWRRRAANLIMAPLLMTPPPQNREDLIKQALAVHKVQSKLLDNLDEDTRRRLRKLAMEAMAIKPDQKVELGQVPT